MYVLHINLAFFSFFSLYAADISMTPPTGPGGVAFFPPTSPRFAPNSPRLPPSSRLQQTQSGGNIRRQASLVENTIPLTTTFVNRMCKKQQQQQRTNSQPQPQGQGQGQGHPWMVMPPAHQRRSDSEFQKRKVS